MSDRRLPGGLRRQPHSDLDVVGATVTYDAHTHLFDFTATLDAPVATTSSAFYVWGIDRGAGTEKFNAGPNPIGAGVKSSRRMRPTPA